MSQQLNICSETALTLKYFSKLLPNALILPMECTSIWKSALKLLWDWNTPRSCCEMPWNCQRNVPAFGNIFRNFPKIQIRPETVLKWSEIAALLPEEFPNIWAEKNVLKLVQDFNPPRSCSGNVFFLSFPFTILWKRLWDLKVAYSIYENAGSSLVKLKS